jgi:hypothetical protein
VSLTSWRTAGITRGHAPRIFVDPEHGPLPGCTFPGVSNTVDYRSELKLAEHDVNPETWAGGLEDKRAIAPRLRVGRDKWFNLLWLIPIGYVLLVAAVAIGKGLRNMPAVQEFITRHPGADKPAGPALGMPAWVGWTHFFNLFLMTFIIRSGFGGYNEDHEYFGPRHTI